MKALHRVVFECSELQLLVQMDESKQMSGKELNCNQVKTFARNFRQRCFRHRKSGTYISCFSRLQGSSTSRASGQSARPRRCGRGARGLRAGGGSREGGAGRRWILRRRPPKEMRAPFTMQPRPSETASQPGCMRLPWPAAARGAGAAAAASACAPIDRAQWKMGLVSCCSMA